MVEGRLCVACHAPSIEGFPPGRSERENSYTLKSHDHGLLIRYFVRVAFF